MNSASFALCQYLLSTFALGLNVASHFDLTPARREEFGQAGQTTFAHAIDARAIDGHLGK
jgi:hypothetical protein